MGDSRNATATGNSAQQPHGDDDLDLLCWYPSKICTNPRVVKRNGELHRFCDYHRRRANENQRRQEERRKERISAQDHQQSQPTTTRQTARQPIAGKPYDRVSRSTPSTLPPSPRDLDADDLRVLAELLFDSDSLEEAAPSASATMFR